MVPKQGCDSSMILVFTFTNAIRGKFGKRKDYTIKETDGGVCRLKGGKTRVAAVQLKWKKVWNQNEF